jgi:hypothetical protein
MLYSIIGRARVASPSLPTPDLRTRINTEQLEARRLLAYALPAGVDPSEASHIHDAFCGHGHADTAQPAEGGLDAKGDVAHRHFHGCGHAHGGGLLGNGAEPPPPGFDNFDGDFIWPTTNLTYSYAPTMLNGGLPGGLSNTQIYNAVEEALSLWAAVSPLTFTFATDPGTVTNDNNYFAGTPNRIRFGVEVISGSNGGTLAHAFPPPPFRNSDLAGDVHFDSLDDWDLNGNGGNFDLIEVTTHEIGHTLGLDHPDQASPPQSVNAIMNAFYGNRYDGPGTGFLFQDDINGVRSLYGSGLGWVRDQSGNLIVSGTEAGNTFEINTNGNNIFVSSAGNGAFSIPDNGINTIRINTRGGSDFVTVDSLDSDINLVVEGFDGNDIFRVGDNVTSIDGVDGNITFIGGDGTDNFTYNDRGNASGTLSYDLSGGSFARTFNGSVNFSNSIESVRINAGGGISTFNLNFTDSSVNYVLDGNDGNDIFNLGDGDFDNDVNRPVTIFGDNGVDTLVLNDADDTGADNYEFDSTGGTTPYIFTKSSESTGFVRFGNDTENIDLTANSRNNIIEFGAPGIFSSGLDFDVFGGDGDDTLRIGNTGNGIANMDSNVSFTGQNGDDRFEYNANNVGAIADRFFNVSTLTGGTGGVFSAQTSTETFKLELGGGNDVLFATDVRFGLTLDIEGNNGNDIVTLGGEDYDTNISGDVLFRGGSGFDSLAVLDRNDTGDDAYNFTSVAPSISTPASRHVFDKALGGDTTFFPDLESFTLNASDGNSAFFLRGGGGMSSNLSLVINADDGNDTLVYGDTTVGIGFYDQLTTFNGGLGDDAIDFNAQVMGGSTYEVNRDDLSTQFTGDLNASSVVRINLNTGNSADTISVDRLLSAVDLTINAGSGNDVVNIGDTNVSSVDGDIDVNLGGGVNTLNYNDQVNANSSTYSLNNFEITRNSSGTVTWDNNADTVRIRGGTGADVFNIAVSPFLIDFIVDAGPGNDIINVTNALGSGIDVISGAGFDDVNVNLDNSSIARVDFIGDETLDDLRIGDGGLVTVSPGADKVLRVGNLSINNVGAADGQLDLNDNAMIVDYSGSSPILSIATLIQAGYNGGAWGGDGIDSNTARLSAIGGAGSTALGFAEAGDLGVSTFMGQSVDSTAVLVRHTFYGDANLDGTVNLSDFLRLRASFGANSFQWSDGNFNFDTTINLSDFLGLRRNFGSTI